MRFRLLSQLALLAAIAGCTPTEPAGPSDPATETYAASLGVDIATMSQVPNVQDLFYKDIVVGTGAEADVNKALVITYAGYLTNGVSFDSGDTPACFLNDEHYIAGWVLGVKGMKVGGKRKLVIGSNLAYGPRDRGTIPANSTLVFDLELKEIRTAQDPVCS